MQVLITGANRGIGQGLMQAALARGDQVTGTARHPRADDAQMLRVDLSDPSTLPGAFAAFAPERLDLLVCNAGVYLEKGARLDQGYDAALWAQTFAVNVTGVFLTVQALLPKLRRAPAAKIAIIASQMGSTARAPGGSYIYRASKAAAVNLGRNLAADLRADGIAIGIYHPGWVQTAMGGSGADVPVATSAKGLLARFDQLSLATTGCFETWDGQPIPF